MLDFRSGSWLTAAHDAINGTSLQPLETNDDDCRWLSKHPIDGAVTRNLCLLDRLAFAPVVPFIEQGVKCSSTSAFAVLAAGGFVIGAQWLVSDLAAEFAVLCWDAEVKRYRAVGEPAHLYEARVLAFQYHKSSARSSGTMARSRSSRNHS
jgi:hypothetical protein